MGALLNHLKSGKILVSDGAWGTFLHKSGLEAGECPELWNITHRDKVQVIAQSYIDAGADMILTNSFGGSPTKLQHFGLQARTAELNRAAAQISREAAGSDKLVLGSIGPTGVMLMMGTVEPGALKNDFKIQAKALAEGGVDAICVETMTDLEEAKLAVEAAREVTDLDIVCTFTFDPTPQGDFRTMMGVSPADVCGPILDAGADVVGSNCGNGFAQMIEIVKAFRSHNADIPLLIHANAGKPVFENGETVFPENPQMMASHVEQLVAAGASIIGGCCGSTPAHITAIAKRLEELQIR